MFCALLVEDSELFRSTLRKVIEDHFPQVRIEEAANGFEAMGKIREFAPDLVFMDIGLPGSSGIKLTEQIKARPAAMVVVILTNYDLPEYRQAAFRSGADCFISKGSPTCMEEVLARIQGALGQSVKSAALG